MRGCIRCSSRPVAELRLIAPRAGDRYLARIEALVNAFPSRHIHVVDLMYRLTTPAVQSADGVALWEGESGDLAGYAAWQPAFHMLDYGFSPDAGAARMAAAILDWADEWFVARTRAVRSPQTCWIKVPAVNVEWIDAIEARQFARCAWSIIHLERVLNEPVPIPSLPDGFSIRCACDDDAPEYAALHRMVFPVSAMTAGWRQGIVRADAYKSDLDLVVVAPDGTLAAFCQGWVATVEGERVGEIEPLGTHPEYRSRRLGSAVLQEVVRRMEQQQVNRVFAEPWDDNAAAIRRYTSLGFREAFRTPTYGKAFA